MSYQYKKKGTSNWIDCNEANYKAYSKFPLSINYLVREVPSIEGPELAEVPQEEVLDDIPATRGVRKYKKKK